MIYAGWCLLTEKKDIDDLVKTARELRQNNVDYFRCKLWGGGTKLEKLNWGIGSEGVSTLLFIDRKIIPCGTEVQTPDQFELCRDLSYLWVGARNCQNYGLLKCFKNWTGELLIKRHPGCTLEEIIGIYQILTQELNCKNVKIVERGINTIDRNTKVRWSPDFVGMLELLKIDIPVVFDISHSIAKPENYKTIYKAALVMGVNDFMFEVYQNVLQAKTDKQQAIDINELKNIIGV